MRRGLYIATLPACRVLKKAIPCFDGLISMNGNLFMNSKQTPFALSLVEG